MTFHRPQIYALAESGIDFLVAKTLPAFDEALGIAHCMAERSTPYILSFIIQPDGRLLDGTRLEEAVDRIDNERKNHHPAISLTACTLPFSYRQWRVWHYDSPNVPLE